jgi:nitrite reductase/ring-hydroxylating ferredoxin subunit
MRGQKDKKVYALLDECAHRGTQLSIGRGCEFPGTNTITCPYHGWTFNLEDGKCVAVLPEGPESQVPGKLRIKTYPVQERQGIIWIWMGTMAPVPLEEDVPTHVLRPDTEIRVMNRIFRGNWRWHAEDAGGGHPATTHFQAFPRMWFTKPFLPSLPPPAHANIGDDVDGRGILQYGGRASRGAAVAGKPPKSVGFPGLGHWPNRLPWWRVMLTGLMPPAFTKRRPFTQDPEWGVNGFMHLLPGIFRSPHPPAQLYYEWYVPVNEDNYIYFQINCWQKRGWFRDLRMNLRWYFWGKMEQLSFNNQDASMVKQTSKYVQRVGHARYLTSLTRYDLDHTMWRQYVNENARGVGYKYRRAQQEAGSTPAGRPAEIAGSNAG